MNSNCCYGASFLSVGSAFLCISFTLNFLHPPESTQPQRRSLAAPGFNTQSLSRNESLFFSGIRTLIGHSPLGHVPYLGPITVFKIRGLLLANLSHMPALCEVVDL